MFVAGGDVDGDGFADIITGTATTAPHVKVFSGATNAEIRSFFAFDPGVPGVSVGTADKANDGTFDIVAGSRIGSHVKVFDGATLAELDSFLAFNTDLNGVFVGGA